MERIVPGDLLQPVAGGGLLHRRALFSLAAASAAGMAGAAQAQNAAVGSVPPWSLKSGAPFRAFGEPSPFEKPLERILPGAGAITGASRTPIERLEGTITPNSLHFERNHSGRPDIDPAAHRLIVHGLVRRPLVFTVENLMRYPMRTGVHFVECGGNSGGLGRPEPTQGTAGSIHGLLSQAEWTGVRVADLMAEAGVDPRGKWVIAEGADSALMSRSVPMEKILDDAMIALFQNGEPIRPEQGYPMRLLLPGFEGNTNVKWLRRLKVVDGPVHSRDETSRYTDLMKTGKARQFVLQVQPKSVILKPSFGINMQGPGVYEISGLAWSGGGRVARVEVSADGGKSWARAQLDGPVNPKALTRFRMPWKWDGGPANLTSRAIDETGARQPTRAEWMKDLAPGSVFHCNAQQVWGVDGKGEVRNVFL